MEGAKLIASLLFVSVLNIVCSAEKKCYNTSDVGEPLILTPYIDSGELELAKNLSEFTLLGSKGYAGFLTVNKSCQGNIFFVFIPAKINSDNAPLLLWLDGGPGSSSMFGFLGEYGPYEYDTNTSSIKQRKDSWNTNNNMLYIDQPVGTGFSFPKNRCLAENANMSTAQLYSGLIQFMTMFSGFQKNEFYLTGQSFAGQWLPILGVLIHDMNQMSDVKVKINLVGILIGNPTTRLDCRNYAPLLYNMGFIDSRYRNFINKRHRNLVSLIKNESFLEAHTYWIATRNMIIDQTHVPSFYNVLSDAEDTYDYWTWLDTPLARCIFNVGNISFADFSEDVYDKFKEDIPKSDLFASFIEALLKKKQYQIVFYSGDLDLMCSTASTDCLLRGLDWWGAKSFQQANRTPWFLNEELAGYVQSFGNLTFLIIIGAGHSVGFYKPAHMKNIIDCINFPCTNDTWCRLNTTVP